MSEFTEYLQALTRANSVAKLRGQVQASVGAAEVPALELPRESLGKLAAADAAWRAPPKPAWVTAHADRGLDALASLSTAFHPTVEPGSANSAVAVRCNGQSWGYAVPRAPDAYRAATPGDDPVLWGDDPAGVEDLAAAMVADGGQAFSARVGAGYAPMQDQNLTDYQPDQVRLAVRE